jgi:hypothetical protein
MRETHFEALRYVVTRLAIAIGILVLGIAIGKGCL